MKPGNIIVLNGASSSGKTTILHELQKLFSEPYLNVGVDNFFAMLPQQYFIPPLWFEVLELPNKPGVVGNLLVSGMHHSIPAMSRVGNNILCDHVIVSDEWLYECAHQLSDLPAFFIGIRCPLEVNEQRESERPDRIPGTAKAHYDAVHRHNIYDLEVDTSIASAEECARQIKQRVEEGGTPNAFNRLKALST